MKTTKTPKARRTRVAKTLATPKTKRSTVTAKSCPTERCVHCSDTRERYGCGVPGCEEVESGADHPLRGVCFVYVQMVACDNENCKYQWVRANKLSFFLVALWLLPRSFRFAALRLC